MRLLPSILFVLVAAQAGAQAVYKNVQPDGTVTYSDRPTEGSQEVELPEIQLYTAPSLQSDSALAGPSSRNQPQDEEVGYTRFAITSPGNDEAVRDNAGNVSITLEVEPALRPGHLIDIRMDGTSIGRGSSTSVSLANVDRGTHTVQAAVLDESGNEVASSSVTFHLRRVSAGLP